MGEEPVLSAVRPGLQGQRARRKTHGAPYLGYKPSMQAAMDRLGGFFSRRRRLVLGIWGVILLASLPFAAQQTKHLTAGGFEVPGSGSLAVSDLLKRFPGVQTEPLILVFDNHRPDPQALQSAVDKAVRDVSDVKNV